MSRPLSEAEGYIDLTKGSSSDFNQLIKTFTSDVTEVFNMTNENSDVILKNQDMLIQENIFLQKKIKTIEDKMKSLANSVMKVKGDANAYSIYRSFYDLEGIIQKSVVHEKQYGLVTLPYEDSQELALSQYPIDFLAKNLHIYVEYKTLNSAGEQIGPIKTITLDDNEDLINILDKNSYKYWFQKIYTPLDIASIDFKVIIEMPYRIIPNLYVNAIGIRPHPLYSLTLKDIKYVDANTNAISSIPNYPTDKIGDSNVSRSISDIDNMKFIFPTVSTQRVELEFNQPYYSDINNERMFSIGFKSIEIQNINIVQEEASFITELKIPGEERFFSTVFEPKVIPIIGQTEFSNELVKHELLFNEHATLGASFGSVFSMNRSKVYIKTTVKSVGGIIPAIGAIEFNYLPK